MGTTEGNLLTEGNPESRLMLLMQRLWRIPDGGNLKGQFDLTIPQVRLIRFVRRNLGCHLQDIAEGLELSPPTVSVAIRKLEAGGWLERRPDPDDGRASCVFLTQESDRVVEEMLVHRKKIGKMLFSGLSDTEQEQLLALLEKGIISIENHLLKQ
ncbi:MAG: MarR family transcriptional regulator [Chloroflexota bacterium]